MGSNDQRSNKLVDVDGTALKSEVQVVVLSEQRPKLLRAVRADGLEDLLQLDAYLPLGRVRRSSWLLCVHSAG